MIVFQGCFREVSIVFQECFKGVEKKVSKVVKANFKGSLKGAHRLFQWFFKKKKFQENCKGF